MTFTEKEKQQWEDLCKEFNLINESYKSRKNTLRARDVNGKGYFIYEDGMLRTDILHFFHNRRVEYQLNKIQNGKRVKYENFDEAFDRMKKYISKKLRNSF